MLAVASLALALCAQARPDPQGLQATLSPTAISRDHQGAIHEFVIRIGRPERVRASDAVSLRLRTGERFERAYEATRVDRHTWRVRARPLPAVPRMLQLSITASDSLITCRVQDRSLALDGMPLRLSQVERITPGKMAQVRLRSGRRISGKLTGLESVPTTLAGTHKRLNLSEAVTVSVKDTEPPGPIRYRVVISRAGRMIDEVEGEIAIQDVSTEPLPPDVYLNPANGHLYRYVSVAAGVTWEHAKEAASGMTLRGMRGHLVTITSPEESAWLMSRFPAAYRVFRGFWLGGYQDMHAPDYSEPKVGWRWVTGEPFRWTNWRTGEPNDLDGTSNYLNTFEDGTWNDTANDDPIKGYIVEFER